MLFLVFIRNFLYLQLLAVFPAQTRKINIKNAHSKTDLLTVTVCIPGFNMTNGICDTGNIVYLPRNDLYSICANKGGYLYDIKNSFENSQLQKTYADLLSIWIGLTCTSNNKSSCSWDGTGSTITNNSYTNFGPDGLNVTIGPCVYMSGETGLWYSDTCEYNSRSGGCKYVSGVTVPQCKLGDGVYGSYFRDNCYWRSGYGDVPALDANCSRHCGRLTSIHSEGENSFVRDLAAFEWQYLIIGLNTTNSRAYSWYDGTLYDYSNFGVTNPRIGNCGAMLVKDTTLVVDGHWLNAVCNLSGHGICIKDLKHRCDTVSSASHSQTHRL